MTANYEFGFQAQTLEVDETPLLVTGRIPGWLSGKLLRTGPAKFTVHDQHFRHWFDGLARLYRFSFAGGQIIYQSRFLQSRAYLEAERAGVITSREFATGAQQSLWRRLAELRSFEATDNCNVNVTRVADCFAALTETPRHLQFDPQSLATLGPVKFDDNLFGQITTAHPHLYERTYYNILIRMGPSSRYQIYSLSQNSRRRQLLVSIPSKMPAYMHSFAVTENFIALLEFPFKVNPLELILSGKPFIENYRWQEGASTLVHIASRDGKEKIKVFEAPSGFAFHAVNAFEADGDVCIDVAWYDDAGIIQSFYLERLRSGGSIPGARLVRLRLNMNTGGERTEVLSNSAIELPRINYAHYNGRPYRFAYFAGVRELNGFIDQLVKTDLSNGTQKTWYEEDCYPGEPVFVPDKERSEEDAGVILSIVLNAKQKRSFLLILDARTFEETARASIPDVIPFHFHGQFFAGE